VIINGKEYVDECLSREGEGKRKRNENKRKSIYGKIKNFISRKKTKTKTKQFDAKL